MYLMFETALALRIIYSKTRGNRATHLSKGERWPVLSGSHFDEVGDGPISNCHPESGSTATGSHRRTTSNGDRSARTVLHVVPVLTTSQAGPGNWRLQLSGFPEKIVLGSCLIRPTLSSRPHCQVQFAREVQP